jgi:hypothetical protein
MKAEQHEEKSNHPGLTQANRPPRNPGRFIVSTSATQRIGLQTPAKTSRKTQTQVALAS